MKMLEYGKATESMLGTTSKRQQGPSLPLISTYKKKKKNQKSSLLYHQSTQSMTCMLNPAIEI
jgi:hypothetical protein